MLINNQTTSNATIDGAAKPFVLVQQSLCRRIPVQRHNQFPIDDLSNAAEIAHGLIVSLDSVVVGFMYIRNDGAAIYEDGFIDGPSVPAGPRSKVFTALQVPPEIPAGTGALVILKDDPMATLVRKGFGLTSCY